MFSDLAHQEQHFKNKKLKEIFVGRLEPTLP
jgi:hypothetical protein